MMSVWLARFDTEPTKTFIPRYTSILTIRETVLVLPHPGGPLINVKWFEKTFEIA